MELPLPSDDSALVLRTDFRDDTAWAALQAAVAAAWMDDELVTYVSDPAFAGLTAQQAASAVNGAEVAEVFIADEKTLSGVGFALLAVDLFTEPGRTFRVGPGEFAGVAVNLAIANMDFADYADAADPAGSFRGFA